MCEHGGDASVPRIVVVGNPTYPAQHIGCVESGIGVRHRVDVDVVLWAVEHRPADDQVLRDRGSGSFRVNTRGDDFFVVAASPSVAVETARAIRSEAAALGLDVRTGLHLGEIERQGDDYAGLAVHIGSRIAALAAPGEILVSQTVRDALVGSGVEWIARGVQVLKGVPDEWRTYAVAR